ncbi:MAG: polyphosphate kinase 1 [Eubacteriales bacterium]
MKDSARYLNRELSWLSFNARVLEEAAREELPLLERAKFLAIVSSNLDEFFMVRVGKLERKADAGENTPDPAGMMPRQQLRAIRKASGQQVKRQYELYNEQLLPELAKKGIHLLGPEDIMGEQRTWLSAYFDAQVMPVLTPRVINPGHPFPLLAAKRIYLAVHLQSDKGGLPQLCLVPVPDKLKRLVFLPAKAGQVNAILLEDVILLHLERFFPYQEPLGAMPLRITRNTDFVMDIDRADNMIEEMRKSLKRRSYGKIVRIEWPRRPNPRIAAHLKKALEAGSNIIREVDGPLDLRFLMRQLYSVPGFDGLRHPSFEPKLNSRFLQAQSIFRTIRDGDIFLHHPYDSFEPVLRFVREAAEDPRVLAIKQTLYRVDAKSSLIPSLARAAQLGKQVTVLVEVRARFDEENNINWCKILEAAGCHVLYGVPRWKTHSKITLVVRRETEGLRHYMHIGTGNYNSMTATQYTDMGILTCDRGLGEDASAFFNVITGYSYTFPMKELIISPYTTKQEFIRRLMHEKDNAAIGLPARFRAKMNSLSDPEMIDAIYEAADGGVKVELLVRGICCLRVGGHENIEVRSIIGRFLEHSRVYIFETGGIPQCFISSADLMGRNLDKRVELTAPLKDPGISSDVIRLFDRMWEDNTHTWRLGENDSYERVPEEMPPVDIQQDLLAEIRG